MHPVILLLLSSITTEWVWLLIFTRFLDHTQRRTTVGRTPLNEWSVRRRDLYLTTQQQSQQTNIHVPRRAEDFYLPLKIRRLRPGLNPRTWVPKASTLPLDQRSRWAQEWNNFCSCTFELIGLAGKWTQYTINIYLPPTLVGDFLLSDKYSPKNAKVVCINASITPCKVQFYCRAILTNILKSWRSVVKSL